MCDHDNTGEDTSGKNLAEGTKRGDRMRKWLFFYAAANGHYVSLNKLLEEGADANAVDEDGWTALIHVAKNDHPHCIEPLLEQGANVNAQTALSETALILAARHGSKRCIQLLLEEGANVNTQELNGTTALMEAAIAGHCKILNLLLDAGADKAVRNSFDKDAMSYAIDKKNLSCIIALMEAGAYVNYDHVIGGLQAVLDGNRAAISLYPYKLGMHPRCDAEMTALMVTAECGDCSYLKAAITLETDVNAKDPLGRTVLMYAADRGHVECVEELISAGADVNCVEETKQITALMLAARAGCYDCVYELVTKGAVVNTKDLEGKTACMYAEEKGHSDSVAIICKAEGHNVNAQCNRNMSALMYDVRGGWDRCVVELVKTGGADEKTG